MSEVLDTGFGYVTLAMVEEPIEVVGDVGVAGFASDATDDFAVLMNHERGGATILRESSNPVRLATVADR